MEQKEAQYYKDATIKYVVNIIFNNIKERCSKGEFCYNHRVSDECPADVINYIEKKFKELNFKMTMRREDDGYRHIIFCWN